MKHKILTGLMAIALSVPCWAGYPEDFTGQPAPVGFEDPLGQGGYGRPERPQLPPEIGQQSQGGQVVEQAGQSDQCGQSGKQDSYGQYGQSGQSGQSEQSGQSGQCGQSNGGDYGQSSMRPGYDPAHLQTVISLLSMIESDLAMCAASSGGWGHNVMAVGHINSARSALERAPMDPAWKPLLAEIYERLGRVRFHLLMNDDMNARMMMNEVQAVVRSTMQSLLINSGNGGAARPPATGQYPRVVVIPQIPASGGNYGSNHGSNHGSGWGSAWGSGWASGWGNGNGTQLPGGTMRPVGPEYPALPRTN